MWGVVWGVVWCGTHRQRASTVGRAPVIVGTWHFLGKSRASALHSYIRS